MKANFLKSKTSQLYVVVIFLALMSTGCGASKSEGGSTAESSRSVDSTTVTGAAKPIAYCNEASERNSLFRVNVGAALNSNNQSDPNYLHLKITNVPSSFTDSTYHFAIWKWYAEGSSTYVHPTALKFQIFRIDTGAELTTSSLSAINWTNISSLASQLGVTTPAAFFQKVRLLVYVDDASAMYDAITVGYHKTSTGVAEAQVDMLIPLFYANPADYARNPDQSFRAQALIDKHPFKSIDTSGWTAATYSSRTNNFCAPLTQY